MDDEFGSFLFFFVIVVTLSVFLLLFPLSKSPLLNFDNNDFKIASSRFCSFSDIVVMVKYNNGWWGLGGIESTAVTFQNGVILQRSVLTNTSTILNRTYTLDNYTATEFTFSGNLVVSVGCSYRVNYLVTTYVSNRTEVSLSSIVQVEGDLNG